MNKSALRFPSLPILFFLMLSLGFGLNAQEADTNLQIEALTAAGDVDGVAALIASQAQSNPDQISDTMERIAQSNPNIAGAVINATLRLLHLTGIASNSISATLTDLTSGALSGLSQTVSPDQTEVYAENIATNIRNVSALISAGNNDVQNTLLASARTGVASVSIPGTQIQTLLGQVNNLLTGSSTITVQPTSDPIVVTTSTPDTQMVETPLEETPDTDTSIVTPDPDVPIVVTPVVVEPDPGQASPI